MCPSKRGALGASLVVVAFVLSATSPGAAPPARERGRSRPNLDARGGLAVSERRDALAANPSAAVKALGASLGAQGIASIDGLTGTPRIVARLDGFLTDPSARPASKVALDYVSAHADDILAQVRAGTMPCDGAWPEEQVDTFQRWIDAGKPR